MTDYYAILGVERDADNTAIKKAYRKLASLYHTDKGLEQSDDKFKELTEVYQTLIDPEKRKQYDLGANTKILALVEQEFMQIILQLGSKSLTVNVVAIVQDSFRTKAARARQDIKDNEAIAKQLRKIKEKVSGPEFIPAMLQKHIDAAVSTNRHNLQQAQLMDDCAAYLEHYKYTPDIDVSGWGATTIRYTTIRG